jgi:hypothetical protein
MVHLPKPDLRSELLGKVDLLVIPRIFAPWPFSLLFSRRRDRHPQQRSFFVFPRYGASSGFHFGSEIGISFQKFRESLPAQFGAVAGAMQPVLKADLPGLCRISNLQRLNPAERVRWGSGS